jgi:hypothetical protein
VAERPADVLVVGQAVEQHELRREHAARARPRVSLLEVLDQLRRRAALGPGDGVVAAGAVGGEAEPGQPPRQRPQLQLVAVEDVADDVAHPPALAQRRLLPVRRLERVEVGGEVAVLGVVQGAVVRRYSHSMVPGGFDVMS